MNFFRNNKKVLISLTAAEMNSNASNLKTDLFDVLPVERGIPVRIDIRSAVQISLPCFSVLDLFLRELRLGEVSFTLVAASSAVNDIKFLNLEHLVNSLEEDK